jgi:hypothetical protein
MITQTHASPLVVRHRFAPWRRRAVILLVLSTSTVGCTRTGTSSVEGGGTPSPSVSHIDPQDRLLELVDAWFRTPATMSYRTAGPVLGQPTTAHLCLRQLYDGDFGEDRTALGEDHTALLRKCSQRGTLRLAWDPPDGWQMDVITPVDRFTLASTRDHTLICRRGDPHACRGIPTAEAIVKAGADIFFQRPRTILAAIGATGVKTTASPTKYAGLPVECFAATGRDEHVEWCYAKDGRLVSFLRGSGTTGWRSFEATTSAS